MNKKYLMVLVIVVAIAAALYLHLQRKKAANQFAHNAKQYERMLAMAQKSPMAGLTQMGAAINKYREAHQAYPPRLMDLYPAYIPSKEFITDIQWTYKPRKSDFHLSKSMTLGGKVRMASVSSTLMPQLESTTMVAARGGAEKAARTVQLGSYEDFVASMAANQALAKRQEAAYRARYREKKEPVIPFLTETVSFEAADAAEVARANILEGRYYCWRNEDGSFGYSNVQYPDRRKVQKYDAGRWMMVQTRFNQRPQDLEERIPVDEEALALAALERHKERDLLVWRDTSGRIGYGNVQYPQMAELEQYDAGDWVAVSSQADLAIEHSDTLSLTSVDALSIAEIGAQYSEDYMVWQDDAGHVGFSNVQYPQEKSIQQYQAGEWVSVAPARLDAEEGARFAEAAPDTGQHALVTATSQHFIVWRDANGHIGISNVQLPTHIEALEIHLDGEWLAAAE
ncbi:MAG: hypothetical protein QNJ22_02150 [Desulfosarcinaceae bacterium]|nr:hypothetical protein [Desulfosarcinaceae bacterium]